MEMMQKQKHLLYICSYKGFTMVELLVAMVVSLLALAGIYSTFLAQHRSYRVQEATAEMQQNIRAAMYYMQREIRMVGSDAWNVGGFGITAANANSITFTEDVSDGVVPPGPPDGDVGDPNENITYQLNGTDLVRIDNNDVPPTPRMVAQNIDWLDFAYLDDTGAETGILADIRSVEITIVARTDDPLLLGDTNNNVYWNQQNSRSYVAPGDNFSRRRLTAQIHCRNLSL